MKLMIVDDNSDILFSLKKGFESLKEDYEIITANGGKECIKHLKKTKPDLILLDIMMPDMDGWDVVAKIRDSKEWATIPIIFLTAKNDAMSKGMAKFGVEDYIVKPITDIKKLSQRIKDRLKSPDQEPFGDETPKKEEILAKKEGFFARLFRRNH